MRAFKVFEGSGSRNFQPIVKYDEDKVSEHNQVLQPSVDENALQWQR